MKTNMDIDQNIKEAHFVSDFKEFHKNSNHEGGAQGKSHFKYHPDSFEIKWFFMAILI
jgi:hypothetical protein